MIIIFFPLTAALIALRVPIVSVLYPGSSMTTGPLWVFALWMVFGALEIIILQFFFSMRDTVVPTIVAISLVPIHIGLAYLGVYIFQWEAIGIAAALLISRSAKVISLYILIKDKLGNLPWARTLKLMGLVLLAMVPLVAVLLFFSWLLPPPATSGHGGKLSKLINLMPYFLIGIAGLSLYGATLSALKVEEFHTLVARVAGRFSRS
jgi:peptidoglycan biosynthesis protein MviN/MurJ (putative lipid II flippase)